MLKKPKPLKNKPLKKTKSPEKKPTPEKKQNPKNQKGEKNQKTKTSNIYNFEYDIVSRSHMHVKDRKNQPIFICDSGKLHHQKIYSFNLFYIILPHIYYYLVYYYHERHNGRGVHCRKFDLDFNI